MTLPISRIEVKNRVLMSLLLVVFLIPQAGMSQQEPQPPESSPTESAFQDFASGKSIVDSLEDISKALEKNSDAIESLEEEVGLRVEPGHSGATMKVVGRVHLDYWGFPESSPGIDVLEGPAGPQDRINFRRVRFGVRGDLAYNMEYRIEMEFAGGNDSEFRDVWLRFNELPFFQTLLIGNQKRPYGLDHLNSSRFNVFLERPFVIEAFNQDARRVGVASYGVSENEAWNWRYGVYNLRLIQDEGNYVNDHLQLEFASRIANTYWYDEASDGRGYAHWAVSQTWAFPDGSTPIDIGPFGPNANEARFQTRPEARTASRWLNTGRIAGADNYHLLGLEKVVNLGPWQFVGEFQSVLLERDAGFGTDVSLHGGYVYASYFLTGEHMPWKRSGGVLGRIKPHENFFWVNTEDGSRESGMGAWQIAARYSWADFNSVDVLGGIGESLTLGLNWYWTPYSRLQINWIHGSIVDRGRLLGGDPTGGDYDILGARFNVDF